MLSSAVLNAADVGVAQVRRRLFLVGELQGMSRSAAPPTLNLVASPVWRGAGDALAGLSLAHEPEEVLSGKWKDLIPAVPPGGNYLHFTERNGWFPPMFEWRSRYWSFLLKLDPLKPSPTIQAHPGPATGPFHWENRRLRLAEQCRLFGYPDDFVFVGSRSSAQRQIGNSVPPPLARFVAEQLGAPPVGLF
jgi:DNA (cytosine-5)-methyltransferase 1